MKKWSSTTKRVVFSCLAAGLIVVGSGAYALAKGDDNHKQHTTSENFETAKGDFQDKRENFEGGEGMKSGKGMSDEYKEELLKILDLTEEEWKELSREEKKEYLENLSDSQKETLAALMPQKGEGMEKGSRGLSDEDKEAMLKILDTTEEKWEAMTKEEKKELLENLSDSQKEQLEALMPAKGEGRGKKEFSSEEGTFAKEGAASDKGTFSSGHESFSSDKGASRDKMDTQSSATSEA